jgi:hypothetical protein
MQRAIDRATVAGANAVTAIEAEYRDLAVTLGNGGSSTSPIAQSRVVSEVLTAAQRARAQADAQVLHSTALRAAAARREVARGMNSVRVPPKATKQEGGKTESKRSTRKNAVSAVVLLLLVASLG